MNIGIDTSNSMLQNLSANSRLNQISLAKSDISALQVNNDKEASTALGTSDAKSLAKIKEMVKDYDFTSITQKELAVLSLELYENELIDLQTASHLSLGDANFNADGTQITDTKFNALELFTHNLEGQLGWASSAGTAESIYNAKAEVAKTNKAVGALFSFAYFSNSNATSIGVNEKA
ncbi:hypothetical protein [Stutzerimonas nitrititolerans]|uniref:hypothetical protein n=1 Tax=Stutzerimonas nitrititolerans TaxID=2482751 RepID=UPI0028A78DAA|nr:hypothetical protein [Stutzerimonas nitrititolerans]|tara:strand:+ start:890 stop:1423 length:534 start_codon:yes stop_codon:yes gene_type:complete